MFSAKALFGILDYEERLEMSRLCYEWRGFEVMQRAADIVLTTGEKQALDRGKVIEAVKLIRARTRESLPTSKRACDFYLSSTPG